MSLQSGAHDAGSGTLAPATFISKSSYQMKPWKKTASLPVMTKRAIGMSECQPFHDQVWASLGTLALSDPINAPDFA